MPPPSSWSPEVRNLSKSMPRDDFRQSWSEHRKAFRFRWWSALGSWKRGEGGRIAVSPHVAKATLLDGNPMVSAGATFPSYPSIRGSRQEVVGLGETKMAPSNQDGGPMGVGSSIRDNESRDNERSSRPYIWDVPGSVTARMACSSSGKRVRGSTSPVSSKWPTSSRKVSGTRRVAPVEAS